MNDIKFLKSVYRSVCTRWALIISISDILVSMLIKSSRVTNTITDILMKLVLLVLIMLITYRSLLSEAKEHLKNYNKTIGENYCLCNLKQGVGAVIGAVTIGETLKFTAQKSNTQYKNFEIILGANSELELEIKESKLAFIDRFFSEELTKTIILKYANKKIKLQSSNPEELYSKILNKISDKRIGE